MRKPSEARLQVLSAVGNGRVQRTGRGWVFCAQFATGADARMLTAARSEGWLSIAREPIDPLESVAVELSSAGREVLTRYWPGWSPDERED